MDQATSTDEPQLPDTVEQGLGETLAQARVNAGLDPRQVADELHLSRSIILALEEERYTDLPQSAYVRGYIRAYARLLQLDAEPLIQHYNACGFEDHPPKAVTSLPKLESGHHFARVWGTVGVVALLIGLLLSWWLNQNVDEIFSGRDAVYEDGLSLASDQNETDTPTSTLTVPALASADRQTGEKEVGRDESSLQKTAYWTLEQPLQSFESTLGRNRNARSAVVEREEATAPEPVEETAAIEADPEPAVRPVSLSSGAPEDRARVEADSTRADDRESQDISAADRLTINFSEASWIEVYDANDERLLYGLLDSGSKRRLQGDAPFEVVLGNSAGVDLSYNGQPFDQSSYVRSNRTARFTVDDSTRN